MTRLHSVSTSDCFIPRLFAAGFVRVFAGTLQVLVNLLKNCKLFSGSTDRLNNMSFYFHPSDYIDTTQNTATLDFEKRFKKIINTTCICGLGLAARTSKKE